MIKKEMFINCLESLKRYQDIEAKIYESSNGAVNLLEIDELQDVISAFSLLLAYCTKCSYDRYSGTDIEYFMYETEFGKKADRYFVTEKDGTEYHWNTPEDLWDYLVKNNPDIDDRTNWGEENETNSDSLYDLIYSFIGKKGGK